MGDFNIDINTAVMDVDELDKFCNLFDLTNLIKTQTCCIKTRKSTIDLILTNRSLSLQNTRTTETGISDWNHKLISTFSKSHYTRLKPKIIYYRQNYKNFNEELFLKDFENSNLLANSDNARSSHPEVFCKKGVLRNFAKFTGKYLCQSLFFQKLSKSTLR